MKLAVVRDIFINESDAMTFKHAAGRHPVHFFGRGEKRQPNAVYETCQWKWYPDLEHLPTFDWYDVVDVPELYHTWAAAIVARRAEAGKRTFVTVWDNIPYNQFNEHTNTIMDGATGFIARSELAANALRLYVDPKKVFCVPAAVDTDLFQPARIYPNKDKPVVLYVGRVTWEKGLMDLVYASMGMPWKVVIVGDGPLMPTLQNVQANFKDVLDIELPGIVPHHHLSALYQAADVFCYPSLLTPHWVEQFGISVIEAFACGTPAVTTDVGAYADMYINSLEQVNSDGEGPFCMSTVPPMRFDYLQAAIIKILEQYPKENSPSPQTHPVRTAARKLAEDKYSSIVVGAELKAIYENVGRKENA